MEFQVCGKLELRVTIPAELAVKVQFVTVELAMLFHIPAPAVVAVLPTKAQRTSVGLAWLTYTAPPSAAEPCVTVKPSTVAALVSPLWKKNPRPAPPQSRMQASRPLAERRVTALPPKSRL